MLKRKLLAVAAILFGNAGLIFAQNQPGTTTISGASQTNTSTTVSCQAYNIVDKSSIVPCDAGYTGVKFKTITKTCPSGTVTNSSDYNTSGCIPNSSIVQNPNTTRAVVNCNADANTSCASIPNAAGCPIGEHWTLLGTGTAHCVLDDPTCGVGTALTHDSKGNPSCTPIPPTCVPSSSSSTTACGTGYTGNAVITTTTSCPNGSWGAPATGTSTSTAGCVAMPVTCVPGTNTVANSPVYCGTSTSSGTKYTATTTTTTCPSGSYGAPSTTTSTSGYYTSGCNVTCSPGSSRYAQSCGAGYSGTMYQVITTSCPNGSYGDPSTNSTYDSSSCVSTMPTCTPSSTSSNNAPVSCGSSGSSGTMFTTTTITTTCPSGIYGSPSVSTSTSGYNTTGCNITCTPSSSVSTSPCPAGTTGTMTSTTTTTCPNGSYGAPSISSTGYNSSVCVQLSCAPPQVLSADGTSCITPVGLNCNGNRIRYASNSAPAGHSVKCWDEELVPNSNNTACVWVATGDVGLSRSNGSGQITGCIWN